MELIRSLQFHIIPCHPSQNISYQSSSGMVDHTIHNHMSCPNQPCLHHIICCAGFFAIPFQLYQLTSSSISLMFWDIPYHTIPCYPTKLYHSILSRDRHFALESSRFPSSMSLWTIHLSNIPYHLPFFIGMPTNRADFLLVIKATSSTAPYHHVIGEKRHTATFPPKHGPWLGIGI